MFNIKDKFINLAFNHLASAKMRKYLIQYSLNAFSIRLSSDWIANAKSSTFELNIKKLDADQALIERFVSFVKKNSNNKFRNLPAFNYLTIWYNVEFVLENEGFIEFQLVLNKGLNKSIWLRIKHDIFNQYNALIGFSEVLKEIEVMEESDRLLIQRLNANARDVFSTTKLLMDYEQLKDFDFEMKAQFVEPIDYFLSYLRHRSEYENKIQFKYKEIDIKSVAINIYSEFFKTSIDLFFNLIFDQLDAKNLKFEIFLKEKCHLHFELNAGEFANIEFIHELDQIYNYFRMEQEIDSLSFRMFFVFYIRLIAEKLGGDFNFQFYPDTKLLKADWAFPFVIEYEKGVAEITANLENPKSRFNTNNEFQIGFSTDIQNEIASYFSKIEGVYILDDWTVFADNLETICQNKNSDEFIELRKYIFLIRKSVESFDITTLQQLMKKFKEIN